jgi:osmotically-inducible protein OsmY
MNAYIRALRFVKGGRTMLLGIVDSAADREIAEVRTREVTGVFEVENSLSIPRGQE